MFEKINKSFTSTVAEGLDTSKFEIKNLKDCIGKEYNLYGYIITKPGKFGKGVLLVTQDFYISLPKRYVEIYDGGLTPDEIESLKSGKCKITNIREIDTSNGKTTTFNID